MSDIFDDLIMEQEPVQGVSEEQTFAQAYETFINHHVRGEAVRMMERFIHASPLSALEPIADREALKEAASLCAQCHVARDVMEYMASLCEAARDADKVRLGPSPRALLALMRAAQALAAIRGRDYVIPDDVKKLAVPVLAHRMVMRGLGGRQNAEAFIRELTERLPAPTESRA